MKSEYASGFKIAASIFQKLLEAVEDAGGTDADVRRIETNSNLRKQIAELVVQGKKLVDGTIRLLVDYTRPLANMLKEDGQFDWVHSDITEKNFPITKRPNGEADLKMFHFNRDISSDQVIQEMNKEGYRPAELPEGLAHAKANPDEQRKYPIVILGSVWRDFLGRRFVPYRCSDSDERGLYLNWFDREWLEGYRFLAVRK
ncbi:MAG: hypothetical protein Q8P76_04240 [bacterium]|nr:hypothetical protein [bacterium]